jgi:hypothetical protein
MTDSGRTVRKMVVGLALAASATAGFAACGSSSTKTQPGAPAGQTRQAPAPTNAPASPATTKAPSSGGASF